MEGKGEVVLRKPLSEKFPNFKNNSPVPDTNVNTVSGTDLRDENESSNETNESSNKIGHLGTDALDIKVISIDSSCKGNGTDHAVEGFGIYWGENHPYNVSEKISEVRESDQSSCRIDGSRSCSTTSTRERLQRNEDSD